MKRITAVCLSSTVQRTVTFNEFAIGKVNRSERYGIWASGKAVNAARVLNQLEKGSVRIVCPIGENDSRRFMELARNDGLEISAVLVPGNTRECWTVLGRADNTTTELVVSEPEICKMNDSTVSSFMDSFRESLSDSDALLMAGSRPSMWPEDLPALICKEAVDSGKIVMADFWGDELKKTLEICVPSIVKINEEEFTATFGGESKEGGVSGLKKAIVAASKKYDSIFIVTRGEKSTFAASKGEMFEVAPERIAKPVSTTACGDAFSAGFLYEYLKEMDIQAALDKGCWCASRNAENECPGSII